MKTHHQLHKPVRSGSHQTYVIDHFRIIAPIYDRVFARWQPQKLIDLLHLEAGQRLLDVGGGTGRIAQYLSPYVRRVWVLDESLHMLQQTVTKPGVAPCAGITEHLPFANGSFERVIAIDSFHHFGNQRQGALEMIRVLAPGGLLVVEEPDIRKLPVKFVALGECLAMMRSHFLNPTELLACFANMPVRTSVYSDGRHTFWVVIEKLGRQDPEAVADPR